jgi:hypothetical protein
MIPLPTNFITDLIQTIKDLFSDMSPLVFLFVGIAVGFWIVQYLLDIFLTKRFDKRKSDDEEDQFGV